MFVLRVQCALAGETDVCWRSSDVEQVACGKQNGAAYDACVAQLSDDAFVCDVDVYCKYGSLGNDERCVTGGFVGKCKSQCFEDSFGDKYCPIDDTLESLSDNQVNGKRPLFECARMRAHTHTHTHTHTLSLSLSLTLTQHWNNHGLRL